MHSLKRVLKRASVLAVILALTTPAFAAGSDALGKQLLRQLWGNMKKPDITAIEQTMAAGFQSVHQFGANDRAQEIRLIRGLNLGRYTLSHIKITRNGPVIVATYRVSVDETIEGKRLTSRPAPRLSVFLKTAQGWKWIAHANLKPVGR